MHRGPREERPPGAGRSAPLNLSRSPIRPTLTAHRLETVLINVLQTRCPSQAPVRFFPRSRGSAAEAWGLALCPIYTIPRPVMSKPKAIAVLDPTIFR